MRKSKFISLIYIVSIIIAILTFAIAVPILCKPFYYLHIGLYDLVETTGYSVEIIKQAYDEMLAFCLGLSPTFSTGALAYSLEGMQHFADCRILFILDFILLVISIISIIVITIASKKKKIVLYRFHNNNCSYYSGMFILTTLTVITLIAITDFNKAFTYFHLIFFPGKSNWVFDPTTDEIINILPEQFFANCAILIVVIMVGLSIYLISQNHRNDNKDLL